MPEIDALRPGDPAEMGGYRLTGRLGDNAYAARTRSGEAVVIKLLHPDVDRERFREVIQPLQGFSAFYTARVLATGVHEDRLYVVSEYIDGQTLAHTGGGIVGVGLHRLAVGTMTALVAIHQAGMVHGDLRPGNVVLGPDGPRVINFGVARAMAASASGITRKVEPPAYTAPERLDGAAPSPAADVFSWAATMAFAAAGRSPFDGGSMAGTVNRVVNAEPELPDLGELHRLIAACLAKDPEGRPSASDALLRLVGDPNVLTSQVGVTPAPASRETAPARRSRGLLTATAAFVAGALVAGAGVYFLVPDRAAGNVAATGTQGRPTPDPAVVTAAPDITPSTTVAPWAAVEKKAANDVELTGAKVTLHEHPRDPVRLQAYLETTGKFGAYARDRTGAFKQVASGEEPVLSPDGAWVALNPWLKFQNSDTDLVKFVRPETGEQFTVSTVKKPMTTVYPVWSRDGGRLLLSVLNGKEPEANVGFVVVDVRTRKATYVETEYTNDAALAFTFTPDGTVARGYWDGKRNGLEYYNLSGQVIRTLHWVGKPRSRDWFSPSGAQFVTVCPDEEHYCVWDTKTGDRRATVDAGEESQLLGWFNENHLLVQDPVKGKAKKAQQVKVIDFLGVTKRVLADVVPLKAAMQFGPAARR
ncbi:serine/threonine-protein kinase [Spongiactinospora sp. TRM90649]|uniref:serine/threonine-protein kinase n=1 Tax=Spongiactinospora sp. TRM90649 TaxID=3031114 RepID=UPI0023FA394A|nr:serine/threonine-protein kinase [Spongiactinospora sp. TRM90649]MDF5755354.1 serine/threonine-protein kinase [Spongiactinospora sp. TRM90649]